MPEHDLGILITFNIFLTMTGIIGAFIGVWAILKQANANTTYLADNARRVAEIAERIDARLRRDFPDIGNELGDERRGSKYLKRGMFRLCDMIGTPATVQGTATLHNNAQTEAPSCLSEAMTGSL